MSEAKRMLPKGWRWVRLGDHTTKIGSGVTPRGGQSVYQKTGIPLIRSQNVLLNAFTSTGLAYISDAIDEDMSQSRVYPGDVLLNITGASIGRACLAPTELCPANVNQHVSIIRPNDSIEPSFLTFCLTSPAMQKYIDDLQAGATRQALTKSQIEQFTLPLPPLDEQRRIVALLDHKLSAVARARAAAQAQLAAAQALPAAYLRAVFQSDEAKGWPRSTFEKIAMLQRGHDLPSYEQVPGKYPIVTSSGISGTHNEFVAAGPGVATGRSGSVGKVHYIKHDYWPHNTALYVRDFNGNHPRFIYYLLTYLEPGRLANATGVPTLDRNVVHREVVGCPNLDKQIELASNLDFHFGEAERTVNLLKTQLATIDALPAALLRQAFNGEL